MSYWQLGATDARTYQSLDIDKHLPNHPDYYKLEPYQMMRRSYENGWVFARRQMDKELPR